MNAPRLAAIAAFTALLPLRAEPQLAPPASVRVDLQMVSVSTAAALQLVPALRDEETFEQAHAEVQGMLARDEAKLLGWPMLWVRSGARSASETLEEFRYATEFNPPREPSFFPRGPNPPQKINPGWGEEVPTSFASQNLGSFMEAEARVEADGKTIALTLAPHFVRFIGVHRYVLQRSPLGIQGLMEQPEFQTSKVATQLHLRSGRPALLAVFVVPNPEPRVELFIVRATATSIPPTAQFPDAK